LPTTIGEAEEPEELGADVAFDADVDADDDCAVAAFAIAAVAAFKRSISFINRLRFSGSTILISLCNSLSVNSNSIAPSIRFS
jgi:hypothetical protein